ncbi:MAG: S4 domain-containing protein, partial [Kiritimatiellaeota bacterium]|nr:S4 domain-containing protein [Kiritimatiellota bacterium]
MADEERLQNFLARRGIASRRAAAALVASGRVAVNGEVESAPGCAGDSERARVAVDGKPVPNAAPRRRTLML